MSNKSTKRKSEYQKREGKRQEERDRQKAITEATDIESLAKVMGIKLK